MMGAVLRDPMEVSKSGELSWSLSDFQIMEELFRSATGAVLKARSRKDDQVYVLKERRSAELGAKEDVLHEVNLLRKTSHRNIIRCYGYFWSDYGQTLYIVLEYAPEGDLYKEVNRRRDRGEYFTEEEIWDVFEQCCLGLEALHKQSIVHRDVKTLNILRKRDEEGRMVVKLADLGVGRQMSQHTVMLQTFYGTPLYASPELCDNKPYNEKTDIWSLGVVLYELAALKPPFSGRSIMALAKSICAGEFAPIPARYSSGLARMIGTMLNTDHRRRPSAGRILGWMKDRPRASVSDDGRRSGAGGGASSGGGSGAVRSDSRPVGSSGADRLEEGGRRREGDKERDKDRGRARDSSAPRVADRRAPPESGSRPPSYEGDYSESKHRGGRRDGGVGVEERDGRRVGPQGVPVIRVGRGDSRDRSAEEARRRFGGEARAGAPASSAASSVSCAPDGSSLIDTDRAQIRRGGAPLLSDAQRQRLQNELRRRKLQARRLEQALQSAVEREGGVWNDVASEAGFTFFWDSESVVKSARSPTSARSRDGRMASARSFSDRAHAILDRDLSALKRVHDDIFEIESQLSGRGKPTLTAHSSVVGSVVDGPTGGAGGREGGPSGGGSGGGAKSSYPPRSGAHVARAGAEVGGVKDEVDSPWPDSRDRPRRSHSDFPDHSSRDRRRSGELARVGPRDGDHSLYGRDSAAGSDLTARSDRDERWARRKAERDDMRRSTARTGQSSSMDLRSPSALASGSYGDEAGCSPEVRRERVLLGRAGTEVVAGGSSLTGSRPTSSAGRSSVRYDVITGRPR